MNGSYVVIIMMILIIFVILPQKRKKSTMAFKIAAKKRLKKEQRYFTVPNEYIGKDCIISTLNTNIGNVCGVIQNIGEQWMEVFEEGKDKPTAVNLLHVTAVKLYPHNDKGRRKIVW